MKKGVIPVRKRYALMITEAAEYYFIGENKLCMIANEHLFFKEAKQFGYNSSDNTIAKIIKICSFSIIVLGTILSFIMAGGSGQKHESSLLP